MNSAIVRGKPCQARGGHLRLLQHAVLLLALLLSACSSKDHSHWTQALRPGLKERGPVGRWRSTP